MSIYITGDTRGSFQRLNTKNFPQQKQMGCDDYGWYSTVIAGLCGLVTEAPCTL